jgi:predicted secreted protein with PEFG-CTERM motif
LKSSLSLFTVSVILIASMSVIPIFGEIQEEIVVTTDKPFYVEGEIAKVTGEVKDLYSGTDVTLIVDSPNNNIVTIAQLTVDDDKKFSTEINLGSALMNMDGTYRISVLYGNSSRTAETTFELKVDLPTNIISISVDGSSTNMIEYQIRGGKIVNIEPDVNASSLIFEINTASEGTLTLTIPRTVFDSVEDGKDAEVYVLADGVEPKFTETITANDRKLVIIFPDGTEKIEIIGTFVVPEFGTIAAMILAVAIISIIAVSAKSRLSIIPRY